MCCGRPGLRTGTLAAWVAIAGLLSLSGWAEGQRIEPAPIPGPVELSVGNESRMALIRAERWLERHQAAGEGEQPTSASGIVDDEEVTRLLPLLDGDFRCLREGENACEAWGRLAAGLSRQGLSVVYRDGTWVAWRNAVLHALAVSQRPDGMGGGCWGDEGEDALRSTRAAYATLRFLLGLQESREPFNN